MSDADPLNPPLTPEIASRRRMAQLWMDAQPTVLSFILASVPRIHDAEDLLQQAAVDVATHFDQYDATRPFVAWAIGIARNKLRAHFRSAGSARLVFSDRVVDALATAHVESHADLRPELDALQHCLGDLADKPRRMLQLRYTDRLPAPQIAAALGSTPGSVRVTLNRLRTQLADCIRARIAEGGAR